MADFLDLSRSLHMYWNNIDYDSTGSQSVKKFINWTIDRGAIKDEEKVIVGIILMLLWRDLVLGPSSVQTL